MYFILAHSLLLEYKTFSLSDRSTDLSRNPRWTAISPHKSLDRDSSSTLSSGHWHRTTVPLKLSNSMPWSSWFTFWSGSALSCKSLRPFRLVDKSRASLIYSPAVALSRVGWASGSLSPSWPQTLMPKDRWRHGVLVSVGYGMVLFFQYSLDIRDDSQLNEELNAVCATRPHGTIQDESRVIVLHPNEHTGHCILGRSTITWPIVNVFCAAHLLGHVGFPVSLGCEQADKSLLYP